MRKLREGHYTSWIRRLTLNRRLAIVGAGYTGLAAAADLGSKEFSIEVLESSASAGGLARGIRLEDHEWPIEPFYHHWFNKEKDIMSLANKLGLQAMIDTYSPQTSFFHDNTVKPFDRPHHVLLYPDLNVEDRFRLGKTLARLKLTRSWQELEQHTAEEWLMEHMGNRVYEKMWKPMLIGKWGKYYNRINMAWFWARIFVRTRKLMYPNGGFQSFTDRVVEKLTENGVKFRFNKRIRSVNSNEDNRIDIQLESREKIIYDQVLVTVSPKLFKSLVNDLPKKYVNQLDAYKSMGAICALFILNKEILKKTYWLNIPADSTNPAENEIPFLVFVEHTNMVSPTHYSGNHIVYCGNYVAPDSALLKYSDDEIIALYLKGIRRIHPVFQEDDIVDCIVSRTDHASPVFEINHSQIVPNFKTPFENLYWASMSHVYPWDRGTNYAAQMGKEVASLLTNNC